VADFSHPIIDGLVETPVAAGGVADAMG